MNNSEQFDDKKAVAGNMPARHSQLVSREQMSVHSSTAGSATTERAFEECASVSSTGAADHISGHRYILINNILCRTESPSGSFRPQDVFCGLDPPPRATLALGDVSPHWSALPKGYNRDLRSRADSVSRDCPIFNVFGVMSGGVLVEHPGCGFLDFTDSKVLNPTVSADDGENEEYYANGDYARIRAEGFLTLFSSIHPYNAEGSTDTPLPWPRALPRMRNINCCCILAKKTSSRIIRRLRSTVQINHLLVEIFERYRHGLKVQVHQATYLPTEIPFRFQCRGMTFRYKNLPLKSYDPQYLSTHRVRKRPNLTRTNNHKMDDLVGSTYSEFHTFTGLPKMTGKKYTDVVSCGRYQLGTPPVGFSQRAEMRVQSFVHPLREEMAVDKSVHLSYKSKCAADMWYYFQRYFTILRVVPCTTCNTPDCAAWLFEDDKDVDYLEAVRNAEMNRYDKRTTNTSSSVIADAWDYLYVHERRALAARLGVIVNCVKRYDAETNKRVFYAGAGVYQLVE
uniref:WGS project CAEQ00000000 data, annotated contig 1842 n=1 Tax=Trypanosoma congolense (strain IL3000) TaxID=1068625 RepID=F9W9A8_TRYCI|nr:unnamed protein product [Trypanosoma congolense IL3000]